MLKCAKYIHCKKQNKRGVKVAPDLFYFLKVALILKKVGDPWLKGTWAELLLFDCPSNAT